MDNTTELLSISKALEQLIERTAHDILQVYKDTLLQNDNTYIIPGVWGAIRGGDLDETQKGIHKITSRCVDEAMKALNIENISPSQVFAIRYLINRTLIYTISYAIQVSKDSMRLKQENILINLPPMGTA